VEKYCVNNGLSQLSGRRQEAPKTPEVKTKTLANGYKISYRNDSELETIYDDIFSKNTYFFETTAPEPYVIDCGGHIGLSVLYFKSLYPDSRIVTFEPNPETFWYLRQNIRQNRLQGVTAVNKALTGERRKQAILYVGEDYLQAWDSTDTIKPDLWTNMDQYRAIPVRTTILSPHIKERVEFIKLDIEGAEYDVLAESRARMSSVNALTLEYHQSARNRAEGKLHKTVELLNAAGFRCEMRYQNRPVFFDSLPKASIYQLIIKATR
jgi:FkbM family methyltransferase